MKRNRSVKLLSLNGVEVQRAIVVPSVHWGKRVVFVWPLLTSHVHFWAWPKPDNPLGKGVWNTSKGKKCSDRLLPCLPGSPLPHRLILCFPQLWQLDDFPPETASSGLAFLCCKLLRWFENLAPCGGLSVGQQVPKRDLWQENMCLCISSENLQHWAHPAKNREVPEMAAGQATHTWPSAGECGP